MDITNYKLDKDENYRICKIEDKLSLEFFSPHQHHYYEMIFFTKSIDNRLKHSIDFKLFDICKNRVFFIADRQIHQWLLEDYNQEFEGYFLVFDPAFIQTDRILLELFDFLNDMPFLDLDDSEFEILIQLIGLVQKHKHTTSKEYKQSLIAALLHFLIQKKDISCEQRSINKERFIVLRKLINEHFKNEKQVSFYAKKMNISVKRLDVITKEISSLSVAEHIHNKIIIEAKRELFFSSKTVQEIAYTLGYHDASYFSRFFKKYVGISPSSFKENNT